MPKIALRSANLSIQLSLQNSTSRNKNAKIPDQWKKLFRRSLAFSNISRYPNTTICYFDQMIGFLCFRDIYRIPILGRRKGMLGPNCFANLSKCMDTTEFEKNTNSERSTYSHASNVYHGSLSPLYEKVKHCDQLWPLHWDVTLLTHFQLRVFDGDKCIGTGTAQSVTQFTSYIHTSA